MTLPPSPLATPEPWNLVADAYADEVMPMFEAFARDALRVADVVPGTRVVDVACGPGTLSFLAAERGARVCALDFSPAMVAQLLARADAAGVTAIEATKGDGMALPYADGAFDAGFSMFGLMFFPDRAAGFAELHRVLRPGARAVVSSWVAMDRLPALAAIYGTLGESLPEPPPPPRPFPLLEPADCIAEMTAGGFRDVSVHAHTATFAVPSLEELVASVVRTNAPVALTRQRFGEQWPAIEATWRERLAERLGPGPYELVMTANMIVGTRAPVP